MDVALDNGALWDKAAFPAWGLWDHQLHQAYEANNE